MSAEMDMRRRLYSGVASEQIMVNREAVWEVVAERQQAIDERDHWQAQSSQWHARYSTSLSELDELRARCEQAIDALREIADHVPGRFVVQSPDYVQLRARARAALLSLAEQT